ncbi:MAG: DNA alkylation repair protein, partial [Holosporaceae bacterium]|nr:DNA alkylation repair protein [Holosporaceae bacterium]
MIIDDIICEIKSNASEDYAKFHRMMIQSESGYGKGDLVMGCRMPDLRKIAKKYCNGLSMDDLRNLLQSAYHEVRTLALIIMVQKFQDEKLRKDIVQMYLANTKFVNNWGLVDISAHHIIGKFFGSNDKIFDQLSDSNNLWENRIAIVATLFFIKQNDFRLTLRLCEKFLKHPHHLIHKACGWMLREVGKKDESVLVNFL